MNQEKRIREDVEPADVREALKEGAVEAGVDRHEVDDYLDLMLDADNLTPEEAGYGHGV